MSHLLTVSEAIASHARLQPDKVGARDSQRALTFAAWNERAIRLANGLLGLGLDKGDRVVVLAYNCVEWLEIYVALGRAGLVAVPVNTGYTRPELAHALSDSGARALVTTRSQAGTAQELRAELPALEHVLLAGTDTAPAGTTTLDALVDGGRAAGPVPSVGAGEDLAVVLYTSGTSGRPRGAMLPHRALLANLDQGAQIDPPVVTPDDVVLLVLPLFHVYGLNAGLGAVARHGATGVLCERFDPVETLAEIRRTGVTSVLGAPPMYIAWSMLPDVQEAFASVRLALSGAAPLPPAVLHRMLDATGHHVFEGYGLTETAPVLTSTLMSEVAKPASIGRPIPGIELKLVDESGADVEEGDPGEIVVRGANVFLGYWPDASEGPDADGWFATGDVALMDQDGDLQLVDRRREMILVSGFNVYPREVEDVLLAHPDIEEAAVLGIAHPYTGESVKALVVLRAGARLSADDVIGYCARSLARFKCPTAVEFPTELPHSATGKVSKGRLRELST